MNLKIIKNNKTGIEYPVTEDEWAVINQKGFGKRFTVVRTEESKTKREEFVPKEVANLRRFNALPEATDETVNQETESTPYKKRNRKQID